MLHTWPHSLVLFYNPISGFPHTCSFRVRLRKRIWGKNGRKKRRKTRQQRKRKVYFTSIIQTEFFLSTNTVWIDQDIRNECCLQNYAVSTWKDKFHHVLFLKTNKLYHVLTPCSESKSEESERFHFFSFRLWICCLWCNENSIVVVGSRGEVPTNHKAWNQTMWFLDSDNLAIWMGTFSASDSVSLIFSRSYLN